MLRARRPLLVLSSLVLLAGGAAACGSEQQTVLSDAQDRLEAVEISGEVGQVPEVEWLSRMSAGTDPEAEVLVEGEGEPVEAGDQILLNYWVGNGFTESTARDTYEGTDFLQFPVIVGEEPAPPQSQDGVALATYLLDAFAISQVVKAD